MNRPLKQSVRDRIELYTLDDDQLQKLESLGSQPAPPTDRRVSIYPFALAGAVAAFLLAFFLTPLLVETDDVRERIAMEVATNHIKLKPLEIETRNIEAIRDYFNKLDFIPVSSKLVSDAGLELIGGRYCSLQGITATQLRVRKPGSDIIQTLYQTEYRKDVFDTMPVLEQGHEPVDIYVKGIKVTIWVEKGLLFALTDLPDERN
jgi:hypothetical protein